MCGFIGFFLPEIQREFLSVAVRFYMCIAQQRYLKQRMQLYYTVVIFLCVNVLILFLSVIYV